METENNETTQTGTEGDTQAPAATHTRAARKSGKKTGKAKAKASGRKLVTATLAKRHMRVVFRKDGKVIATSATYNTGNTVEKVIAYAKRQLGSGKVGEAKAVAQTSADGEKGWTNAASAVAA